MPSKCIADKILQLRGPDGIPVIGFQVFGGKHSGQYIQGEVYPADYLAKKYKYDFELVEAESPEPKPKPKKKPKDSGAGVTDNEPAPPDSATAEGGND